MDKSFNLVTLIVILLIASCSNNAANPPGFWQPDTSGNGDNSMWIVEGSVTYGNGVIYANNPSTTPGDTAYGSAMLSEPKDFGHTPLVTFSWHEEVDNGAEYTFMIGERLADMSELPYHEVSLSNMQAQVQFWLDFRALLLSRFEFTLPPGSYVKISDYRSAAEN